MTARWIKKRRTVREAREYLLARYAEQSARFPELQKIGEAHYVRVNLMPAQTYYVPEAVTP